MIGLVSTIADRPHRFYSNYRVDSIFGVNRLYW
jgi:hypothetical protein